MRLKIGLFLVAIVAFSGVWWVINIFSEASPDAVVIEGTIENPVELRAQIKNAITQLGAKKAYADIAFAYRDAGFDMQHNMAHILGEELLVSEGIEGIQYCDPRFAFGCYHGFFTNAVSVGGLNSVSKLDEACNAITSGNSSACQHGIGHGLVEYFGNDQLEKALELCKKTTQPNPLAGCSSGVFMEYNIPLRYSSDGSNFFVEPRPFDAMNPYAPCPTVAEEFQASCYHELPQWWARIFEDDWRTIGTLCMIDDNDYFLEVCFHGMGGVVGPSAGFEPARARDMCNEVESEKGVYLCRSAAAWSIFHDGAGIEASKIVCPESSTEHRYPCPIDKPDTI